MFDDDSDNENSHSESEAENSEATFSYESEDNDSDTVAWLDLAKKLSNIIKPDITHLHRHQKLQDIDSLIEYNPLSWLQDRPPELVHFLSQLTNTDLNTCSKNKCMLLCKIIEQIYYVRNSKLVLPCHFTESVMSYSLTNSKSYCNFVSNRGPGGSYTSLSSWLNRISSYPLLCPHQDLSRTFSITIK